MEGIFCSNVTVVSLCSQRCASGRLTRSLQWLVKECEDESVCGVAEMRLALDIAWAGCIGCGCGDELDALAALSHWNEYDDKSQEPVTVSRHQQMLVGKQNYVEDSVYQCKRVDSELEKGWVL